MRARRIPTPDFGCSGCHGGLDRAVDFARVGHSPLGEVEKEEWIEKWGWEAQPYLETPIFPAEHSEAGCFSCHAAEVWTPESEVQDIGRELVSRMGCFACHKIDYLAFTEMPRPGPNLAKVAAKVDPAWAYKWISAPREFRPTTWMPHFFLRAKHYRGGESRTPEGRDCGHGGLPMGQISRPRVSPGSGW